MPRILIAFDIQLKIQSLSDSHTFVMRNRNFILPFQRKTKKNTCFFLQNCFVCSKYEEGKFNLKEFQFCIPQEKRLYTNRELQIQENYKFSIAKKSYIQRKTSQPTFLKLKKVRLKQKLNQKMRTMEEQQQTGFNQQNLHFLGKRSSLPLIHFLLLQGTERIM